MSSVLSCLEKVPSPRLSTSTYGRPCLGVTRCMYTFPFMRYSCTVCSPSVRTVTCPCGSSAGSDCTIGGGGGGSSSGAVPGGRARAPDCAKASRVAARRTNARTVRMAATFEGSLPLEGQLRLAFGRRGLEAAKLVVVEDRIHDFLRIVDDLHEVGVIDSYHAVGQKLTPDPLEEPAPEGGVHEDYRHASDLSGLHEGEHLHQLVERAEAARHHHEGAGELHEHHLAREEVLEGVGDVLVGVLALLVGQLDVQAHARALPLEGALVHRLHDPGAAAGNHREPGFRKTLADVLGHLVVRMLGRDARAAEDRDGGLDRLQPFGGGDEL